jgi:PIN domain nuclease of toxin-antitoxin system
MNLLLDSHTLLWALYDPRLLPSNVRLMIQDQVNQVFVSYVSPWEITDKATKYRLPMAGSSADRIVRDIEALRVTLLPIDFQDIIASVKLPRHHNDPLDRLLIAQAQRLGATLLSVDGKFKLYDVPILWG